MKSSMYDLFLSRADGARIEAWQIVGSGGLRGRGPAPVLCHRALFGGLERPGGGEPGDREALDFERFGAQAWTAERVLFTIGTYEGGMWVYGAPRHPPECRDTCLRDDAPASA